MLDRETIGRNLRDARENCDITQQTAAEHLGLSRTLIAQIELGNRPVSPDELAKLAGLYGQSVVDLVGEEPPSDDDLLLVLFDLAPELLSRSAKARTTEVLALCREATSLERRLGRTSRIAPPHYELPTPRTAAEALAQGDEVAGHERQRLGIGAGPIQDVSELVASQGIRLAIVDLPDDLAGLFLLHDSVGAAIWINLRHTDVQQEHSFAHEYAHSLLDRERAVVVTKRGNAGELVEKRANAFASAFLLPEDGLHIALASLNKGQASRQTHVAFDGLRQEGIRAESRTEPGSQAITYLDVCTFARRFRTSYPAVVYRLRALDVLSDADMKVLLGQKTLGTAERLISAFDRDSMRRRSQSDGGALDLKFEIVGLAVEGYRRGVVDSALLERVAGKLQLPQLPSAKLLELADAAR